MNKKYLEITLNKLEFKKIRGFKTVLLDSAPLLIDSKFNESPEQYTRN
ncbi:MAG: hypothetical protein PHQ17_00785 [Methanobacterium sp.]|jgi:hypothetical protein|nr:hypothetical protein [Methanobacterium sp.]